MHKLALFAVVALVLGALAPARAADTRLFTVRDVPVDATAAGAAEARDLAFQQGQGRALEILLKRLTLRADWGRLPTVDAADLKRFISGFGVSGEKRSATRYIGKMSYDFIPDRVRGLLHGAGIPFSETRAKPIVVFPLLETADGMKLLWESENIWATAWREKPVAQSLVPMIVPPPGDPTDTALRTALDALDWTTLAPHAGASGASTVLVATAALRRAGDRVIADVRLVEVTPSGTNQSRITAEGGEELEAVARGVEAVAERYAEAWKAATVIADGTLNALTADVTFSGLPEWLQVRRALQAVPTVKEVRVIGLAAEAALIEISYVGTSDQLATGLAQNDLTLTPTGVERFTLASRAPPQLGPPPGPPPMESGGAMPQIQP